MVGDSLAKLYIVIGAKTEQFSQAMGKVEARMQKVSTGMRIAGAAFTAVGVAGLKLSADARKLNATLGQTALNIGSTTKEMRDLALAVTNVTFSLNEVVSTFDLLARAGVNDTEVLKKVSTAFDTLGDAINVPASQVTAQLIPAMKTFNVSAEQMAGKTDSLTWLFRNTTVNLEDFNRMVGYTTPELVEMGLTVEDMIAILAELEEQGYSGEVMTREFRKAVTEATKEQKPLNEALGISTEKIEGYKAEMEAATGITQKYADVANEQYGVMDKLKQKMSEMTFVMGSFLTPLEPILVAMTALGPAMIFLSTSIGIATVKWVAHKIAVVATTLATKLATAAQWAWNTAMAANPIGLLLAGIGLLVIAIAGISRGWKSNTETMREQLAEQTRLVQEAVDKQRAAILGTTNAKLDALQKERDAAREGREDTASADQKAAAIDAALTDDEIEKMREAGATQEEIDEEVANHQKKLIDWMYAAYDLQLSRQMDAEREHGDSLIAALEAQAEHWQNNINLVIEYTKRIGTLHQTEWQLYPIAPPQFMTGDYFNKEGKPTYGNIIEPGTIPKLGTGALITKPMLGILGEKGPEMVLPLQGAGSPLGGDNVTNNNFNFPIANLVVREEADIKRIARELYNLQRINARSAGVA